MNCATAARTCQALTSPKGLAWRIEAGKGVWENEAPNVDNSFSGSIFSIFPKIATEIYYDRK